MHPLHSMWGRHLHAQHAQCAGDALIGIEELGVPWSIALNLTFPERVTPHNLQELQALVDAGPHPPPGKTGARLCCPQLWVVTHHKSTAKVVHVTAEWWQCIGMHLPLQRLPVCT